MQNIDGRPFIIFCSCSALKIPAGLIYNGSDIGIISVRGVANAPPSSTRIRYYISARLQEIERQKLIWQFILLIYRIQQLTYLAKICLLIDNSRPRLCLTNLNYKSQKPLFTFTISIDLYLSTFWTDWMKRLWGWPTFNRAWIYYMCLQYIIFIQNQIMHSYSIYLRKNLNSFHRKLVEQAKKLFFLICIQMAIEHP